MLQHGIEFAIFTFSGKLLGQLTPARPKNIFLRMDQFQRHQDAHFCLEMAKLFVTKKIESMLEILTRHQKHNPASFSNAELESLKHAHTQTAQVTTAAQLLGIEGAATATYFPLLGRMFIAPWQFQHRTRRPPRDPVNAVLSFGYVIVGAEIQSLLDGMGLDPFLGFYHTMTYGRPSFALDLLEEFRHELVDRLALNLFNLKIVNEQDFYHPPEGGTWLNTSGRRKFFENYEKMAGKIHGATPRENEKAGFRQIFQKRVAELARIIQMTPSTPKTPTGEEDFESDAS
jgi:CRISPR-associated protein Cas1